MGYTHRKGYTFEKYVADKFKVVWPNCERAHAGRVLGDLVGTGRFFIECKRHETLQTGTYVRKLNRIHPTGNWILVMRGGKATKKFGDITVIPCGRNANDVYGYPMFRLTDFLVASGGPVGDRGFSPVLMTFQGNKYYVQTLDATIAWLKNTNGERPYSMKIIGEMRPRSPIS